MKIVRYAGAALAMIALLSLGLLAGVGRQEALGFVESLATTQEETPEHRVTICHDVEGEGNTGNGYNIITVDKDSISTLPNGHDGHDDIIPAFAAGFTVGPPPKQWNAYPGKGDASLIETGCVATETTTSTTTGTETTTTTETNPCPSPPCIPDPQCTVEPCNPPTTTTTTTETQPPRCPPGEVPTDGKDGEPGNEECEPPGGTTTTETTTTTSAPPATTTGPPTETTAPPETTTPPQTTPEPPAVKPPAAKPPKAKPPVKSKPPKAKPPKMPPPCPVAKPVTGRCAVQGSG